MCCSSSSWALLFSLLSLLGLTVGDTTTVVSVTRTTTIHITATDYSGACDNFVGACVVYGTAGNAPYTTTVYVGQSRPSPPPPPPPTVTTSTTTILATTTASNSGACKSFVGACVVYASNAATAAPASTVYYHGGHTGPGNNQGYIGQASGNSDGYIGGASVHRWSHVGVALSLGAIFGLMIWI